MSNKMTEFKVFNIMQYEEEQVYLREQHQRGWKLLKVTFPGFYTFEQCEPEDVIYQLDYNKEGRDHISEYVQIFKDCGWEYLFDFVGYSYFRKPVSEMQTEEEIFSDDRSKLEMLERVYKGRMVPLLIVFVAIIIPQLFMLFTRQDSFAKVMFGIYCIMFFLYVSIFAKAAIFYNKLKRKY